MMFASNPKFQFSSNYEFKITMLCALLVLWSIKNYITIKTMPYFHRKMVISQFYDIGFDNVIIT